MCQIYFLIIFVALSVINLVLCEFVVPPIKIKAFKDKGFVAYIEDKSGIKVFAFHANINQPIVQVEPGKVFGDVTSKKNGLWIFENDDVKLNIDDTLHYWVFVQFEEFGYRKDGQVFKISELFDRTTEPTNPAPPPPEVCSSSLTEFSGKTGVCGGSEIFREDFNTLNESIWLPNVYLPKKPDYEFVSYENNPNVLYNAESKLYFKPTLRSEQKSDLKGNLDLTSSCTETPSERAECNRIGKFHNYLPPIISSRLSSKFTFKYGTIEVRAKLPEGDWIYPQLYLEDEDDPNNKLVIAYCRGNKDLTGKNKLNIGSRTLFGGVITSPFEPQRSKYLSTKQSEVSFNKQFHTYKVNWLPDLITLYVDGEVYGQISSNNIKFEKKAKLVLGVGVGGFTDFPDGFVSGDYPKPWQNNAAKTLVNFFNAKDSWKKTWNDDHLALEVDYVKIFAAKKE